MSLSRLYFILGATVSFLLALLHIVLIFRPKLWRYFGAGELTTLAEQGSQWVTPVTFSLVLLFVMWGFYGLSGADLIRPLPWLSTVIFMISIIYILRGFALPFDLAKAMTDAQSIRFAMFSMVSLLTGIFYLFGNMNLNN